MAKTSGIKIISDNRRVRHDYFILESFEAGVALRGTEVKSLRQGKTSLQESYIIVRNEEVYITNWHIPPYEQGNIFNHDATRTRKLLLHKREIKKLDEKSIQEGLTIMPVKAYFKDSKVKLEIALCRGKKLYDKRETTKKRDIDRKIAEASKRSKNSY